MEVHVKKYIMLIHENLFFNDIFVNSSP